MKPLTMQLSDSSPHRREVLSFVRCAQQSPETRTSTPKQSNSNVDVLYAGHGTQLDYSYPPLVVSFSYNLARR